MKHLAKYPKGLFLKKKKKKVDVNASGYFQHLSCSIFILLCLSKKKSMNSDEVLPENKFYWEVCFTNPSCTSSATSTSRHPFNHTSLGVMSVHRRMFPPFQRGLKKKNQNKPKRKQTNQPRKQTPQHNLFVILLRCKTSDSCLKIATFNCHPPTPKIKTPCG